MHACLLIPDLIAKIAEACAPRYRDRSPFRDDESGMRTLCALARTCRALQGPALDVIWYHQINLNNLISLMPDGFWISSYHVIQQSQFSSPCGKKRCYNEMYINTSRAEEPHIPHDSAERRQAPSTQDFDRFNFYAPRVRKLEIRQYARQYKEIPEHTYKQLCVMNGGGPCYRTSTL